MRHFLIATAWSLSGFFLTGCEAVDYRPAAPMEQGHVATSPEPALEPSPEPFEETVFLDPFDSNEFGPYLKAMGEERLGVDEPPYDMRFRFLWLRSKDAPFMVRGFTGDDGKIKLHMRGLNGTGSHAPGQKVEDTFVHLTASQSAEVLDGLSNLNICETKSDLIERSLTMNNNEANWLFEWTDGADHCVKVVTSPKDGNLYRAFGIYLLKASRIKTWEIDVY